ncbi:MAG: AAA family ATPase [Rhodocyclaceae bacterium]|nr:AAA family ATPase [Rhodocyclaceae bacterium]
MSLYLEHFGLREPPFRITPHTDFFFTGANRGPTLDALIYAITQDEGIVKVTGEVGSGKTMLCRMLLERLPDEVESLYLANPSLSRSEILGAIADELGIPVDGKTTHSMIRTLQDALVQRYAKGKRVVILIDEAHAMPAESLEEIRLLSNLESKATKLLQIALFAQPEIEDRLAANDMRQLRERITQHFNLSPLKASEVGGYLEFRLRAAGYHGPNPFTARAIEQIARISEGLSRRINILADKALLAAYSAGSYKIDTNEIQAANQDARFSPLQQKQPFNFRPLLWGIGSGTVVVTIALALFALWPQRPSAPTASVLAPAPAPELAPTLAAPVITPESSKPALTAMPPPDSPPTAASNDTAISQFGPLTQDALARFATWQANTSRERYFIQLLATDAGSGADVENFLAQTSKQLNLDDLRVYRSSLSGRDRIGVIFGDYPNRQAASTAIRTLPEAIRLAQPYPRQALKLQQ